MSVVISWHDGMGAKPPIAAGKAPKKPVVWTGAVWIKLDGSGEVHTRTWRSNGTITVQHGQEVLDKLLSELIDENAEHGVAWSGFWMKSR